MNSLYLENSIIGSLLLFSIFFYGDTANAIPTDLVGHRSGSLAGLPVFSLSSSEFLVPGDASLLK